VDFGWLRTASHHPAAPCNARPAYLAPSESLPGSVAGSIRDVKGSISVEVK